jgi:hypothetical protein
MKSRTENRCLHYLRTKSATNRKLVDHLWDGFASFHWLCFGEYLRAHSEQQVEHVVWKASSNSNAEQTDR